MLKRLHLRLNEQGLIDAVSTKTLFVHRLGGQRIDNVRQAFTSAT